MDLTTAIQTGVDNPLLFFGTALILGALHGLEPGHSKTMMAAFIVAVRGTVTQAVLLGLSAAISHSLIVWILALVALRFGNELIGEEMEPYFILGSGVLVLIIAVWMAFQILSMNAKKRAAKERRHSSDHHHHDHGHGNDHHHDHGHHHDDHDHDAHAHAHAKDIQRRFGDGQATTWQTIVFGLTGGLIPCSAAITVLILCLHLGKFWMGVGLVSAFSAGLALTFIAVGTTAAISLRYVAARTDKLDVVFDKAPYVSVVIISFIGFAMIYSGWEHLPA